MSTVANPIRYFLENFGKQPEPRPPIIPGPWRIPFFVAVSVISLVVLFALVRWVVLPAIHEQQTRTVAPRSTHAD